ncbi:MAG TPA: polysaccharide deacetylase family protein [Polyangia bacterium]|nr:polysaccharide deacetylase family protein [Polyangia bacterium]
MNRRLASALPLLLALLWLLSLPAGLAAWGSIDDVRYKVKGADGNLWAHLLGQGQIVRGTERPGTIAFTFDDGPDHRSTPVLLDQLDRYGIKVAFFVNGHRFHHRTAGGIENQAVLRDIHRRGHFIGNHTFTHKDITPLNDEGWRLEVTQGEQVVQNITGQRPHLFRPPFGRADTGAVQRLSREGYTVVMWNLDPLDWKAATAADLLARTRAVVEENPQGGILLLHDTNRNTVEAFGPIVEWLQDRNAKLAAEGRPGLEIVGIEHYVMRCRC